MGKALRSQELARCGEGSLSVSPAKVPKKIGVWVMTEREAIKNHNRRLFGGIFPQVVRGKRITIHRAGNLVKARFQGQANFVFGRYPEEAVRNLKYWSQQNV